METQMRKTNTSKESPPYFAGHCGHVKGNMPPLGTHPSEQRDELLAERKLRESVFPALGSETDNTPLNVNVLERKASLAKAAALLPSYEVADEHPIWFVGERFHNLPMLCLCDAWLTHGSVGPDTEALARINASESALDGLEHDDAENLQLVKRRVLADFVASEIDMTLLTPLNEGADVLPVELPREIDAICAKESRDVAPAILVTRERLLRVRVALVEEIIYPRVPQLSFVNRLGLKLRKLAAKLARLARLAGERVAVAGALTNPLYARVESADPPEGRAGALVEGCHNECVFPQCLSPSINCRCDSSL
jgi:hypothetical protein